MRGTRTAVHAYIAVLAAALGAVLTVTVVDGRGFDEELPTWLLLTVLFMVTEYADVYFHDRGARFALTGSEAVLMVMIVGLSFPQVVWGVTAAMVIERSLRRAEISKIVFNVAQYGCAAAAAAGIWHLGADETPSFSIADAGVAVVAVTIFAILSHIFTSIVVALVERRPIIELSRSVAPATVLNVVSSWIVGLVFSAAYAESNWSLLLFPVAVLGVYLGFRATLRTQRERDRVEQLYAATRALASSLDVNTAIIEFMKAVSEILSTPELRVVLAEDGTYRSWVVRSGEASAVGDSDVNEANAELINLVSQKQGSVVVGDAEELDTPLKGVLDAPDARTMLLTPLFSDGRVEGYMIAIGRVGAEDFSHPDGRLFEALGQELMLSLESYRLFQEIADERERFARIFLGSKEGICLIDADGVVRAWNPTLERLTGYIASEVMGRVWSEIVMMRSKDQQRIEGSALVDIDPDEEVELVSRDGPTRWVSVLAGPVQAEGGGSVVLLRDVTAQHEVEQAKSDFLSTISHELRTPLTTIKGSLQVLERNPENLPPDLTRQMIGVTSRGAERLERLVMNLLIVSQIESGTMPLFTDELHLQDIVSERIGIVLREHENVVMKIPDDPLLVRADRERLGQALDHVFDNAMKFGREGTITVAVQRLDGYADVSVSDEGPGIAAVDKERIFDRFVRLGDVLTRETQGAGVGLFIAREAMAAMNGEIWVESTPGKGSTFHLKVPMARPIAVARSEAS